MGHSPGLLPDKRSYTRSRDGPNLGVTEAPGQDYLSLTPSRPGRGYGAGPAAVKGGSTGFRHGDNNMATITTMQAPERSGCLWTTVFNGVKKET